MKKILIIFSALIAFALSVTAKEQVMTQALDSWNGEDINKVIDYLGYPESEKTIAKRHIFIWKKFERVGQDQYGYKKHYFCKITLETDENDIVIKNYWQGNSCPIIYTSAKQLFNPAKDERRLEKQAKKAVKAKKQEN